MNFPIIDHRRRQMMVRTSPNGLRATFLSHILTAIYIITEQGNIEYATNAAEQSPGSCAGLLLTL